MSRQSTEKMTSETVIVSGQGKVCERSEKLNTAYHRQNSGNEVTGKDGYFCGMLLLKGHGIGRGVL